MPQYAAPQPGREAAYSTVETADKWSENLAEALFLLLIAQSHWAKMYNLNVRFLEYKQRMIKLPPSSLRIR